MFKSKARKKAEFDLKVEQEKQKAIAEEEKRRERSRLAYENQARDNEELKKKLMAAMDWFGRLRLRNKVITIALPLLLLATCSSFSTEGTRPKSSTPVAQPSVNPQEIEKSEAVQFIEEFKALANASPNNTHALDVVAAWERGGDENLQAAYKVACRSLEAEADYMKEGIEAEQANREVALGSGGGETSSVEEYQTYYKIKQEATRKVGCGSVSLN